MTETETETDINVEFTLNASSLKWGSVLLRASFKRSFKFAQLLLTLILTMISSYYYYRIIF